MKKELKDVQMKFLTTDKNREKLGLLSDKLGISMGKLINQLIENEYEIQFNSPTSRGKTVFNTEPKIDNIFDESVELIKNLYSDYQSGIEFTNDDKILYKELYDYLKQENYNVLKYKIEKYVVL